MITVLSPGARTLVQDQGRHGYAHLGVPTAGAADRESFVLANRLAGNPDHAAALEVTLHGPSLRFDSDAVVAYAGPDTDITVDGTTSPSQHTLFVKAGQTVSIGSLRNGIFGYLAIRGGLNIPPTLGSASTCTLSGLGPAPVEADDILDVVAAERQRPDFFATPDRHRTRPRSEVRYVAGPHADLFDTPALCAFHDTVWTIAPDSSRVGVRLNDRLPSTPQESLPSLGMVTGAIQVPPSGQPIILGPDHGTTGGYPVIGVVIGTDIAHVMQSLPGTNIILREVTLDQADQIEAAATQPFLTRLDKIDA